MWTGEMGIRVPSASLQKLTKLTYYSTVYSEESTLLLEQSTPDNPIPELGLAESGRAWGWVYRRWTRVNRGEDRVIPVVGCSQAKAR